LGSTSVQLSTWKDQLRSGTYATEDSIVPQLNSIKPPNIQVCKEALDHDVGLAGINFTSVVSDAKKAALKQMIEIKNREENGLREIIQPGHIANQLKSAWATAIKNETSTISVEVSFVMHEEGVLHKVSQAIAAIGISSYEKAKFLKEKRLNAKKEARIESMDVDMEGTGNSAATTKKQLQALVDEALKRKMQSNKDKRLSGKGQRRNGTSKKQNPKRPGKRQRESAKNSKGKAKPSARQPLKRSNAVRKA